MKETITLVSQNRADLHSLTNTHTSPTFADRFFQNIIILHPLFSVLFVLPVTLLFPNTLHANDVSCVLACNQGVNVSLPASCEAEIEYDMILEGITANNCSPYGPNEFEVVVMGANGFPVPTSPFVDENQIGKTLTVKVKHLVSGNSCWGSIDVEDKLPPLLVCPADITVACTQPTNPGATGQASATDCSDFTIQYVDNTVTNGCNGTFAGVITRTWTAQDDQGNSKTCVQKINIARPANSDVVWPPHMDGNNNSPHLNCVNPDTHPDNTGWPTIGGVEIPSGTGYCHMAVDYSDQILPLCENSYKILRNWTVVSWCTGSVLTHTQIIAVKDTHAPALTCPAPLTVGTTSSVQCKATVILPAAGVSDDCSSSIQVTMLTPAGSVNGNGGVIHNINLGTYTIKYTATDDCGNKASCNTTLTVVDDDAPTVVCDEFTVTTLNSSGYAVVFAQTFDDGTYDNCGSFSLSVRRMTTACGTQPVFGPTVKFCCEDVGEDITVEMKATDAAGNSNTCMVTIHVDDHSEPAILCPPQVTLTCLEDPTNLVLTGEPAAILACGTADITYSDVNNLNMCDVGVITRTWTATAGNGNSNSCTQTIQLVDNTPVVIDWPDDYEVTGCVSIADLDPENLPAPYDYPVVTKDCEFIATNVSDQVFTVAAPACFKIVRTWTLIDWCTYTQGGNTGIWTHNQIIKVTDNDAPVFTCPPNQTVSVDTDCKAVVTLPQITDIQDCSQNTAVFVSSPFGTGYGPFAHVDVGNYTATYTVADGCNNQTSCSITIEVVDLKKPTPFCKAGLITELMGVDTDGDGVFDNGMAVVTASAFNDSSFDNCPGTLKYSFSPDIQFVKDTFDCAVADQQVALQVWVTDASGNQDFCETYIVIQDNMGVCSGNLYASVGGAITNEDGNSVENVAVTVNYATTPPAMTGPDGNFQFPALPLGNDYTVTPAKDTNLLNGVTTYDLVLIRKHVLGTEALGTPYRIIAADVNRSGSITTLDMVAVQKVILFMTDTFPGNESWRFIDAAYTFPNEENPFLEEFPEIYNINNFSGNMDEVDFIAVKVGDVNGSAAPNFFAPAGDDRSGGLLTLIAADSELKVGKEYRLDVTAENFKEITGYQFTLEFDPYTLEYSRVEKGELPSLTETNFGFRLLEKGAITTSWNDFGPVSLEEGAVLFSLVFRAKTNTTWAESVRVSSAFTPAEAYQGDGEFLDVDLVFQKAPEGYTTAPVAFPNPFHETTVIGFLSDKGGMAVLTVFDASGRVVETVRKPFDRGEVRMEVQASQLNGPGTYFYQLQTGEGVETGKLVLQ